jgi:hypothetical protein
MMKTSVYTYINKYKIDDQTSIKLLTQHFVTYTFKINEYWQNLEN